MTAENLSALAGVLLSLIFSYVPKASDWFAGLSGVYKRLVMLLLLAVVAGVVAGLACAGLNNSVTCDQSGLLALVNSFISALIVNQATYLVSPKTNKAG